MRSVKSLVAAGAASLLSTAAFAADMAIAPPPMPYAPPPMEDFGGWYLRGDIGFSNQSIKNIRKNDPLAYAQISALSERTGFDTAGTFDIGGGQFGSRDAKGIHDANGIADGRLIQTGSSWRMVWTPL